MSSRHAALAAACIICSISSPLAAAPDEAPSQLDPIVTTATRTPRPASELLAPVVVIDRAAIERSLAADLSDLLRFYAGIDIARSGGPGQTSSAFLRGTESNHVLLLVDGVELNPGTIGGAPFAAIPLAAIERIEIVFGPRAVLYGSEAIGGVINLITKRGGSRPSLSASASYGAQDTGQAALGGGFAAGRVDGSLDLERFATEGYVIQPATPVARGNDRSSLNANLGWSTGTWQLRLARFESRGMQEYNDFSLAPVSQSYEDATTALTLVREAGTWRSTLSVAHYDDSIVQDQLNPFTTLTDFVETARDTADWKNDLMLGRHAVTLGAYWSDEATAAESFGAYQEDTYSDISLPLIEKTSDSEEAAAPRPISKSALRRAAKETRTHDSGKLLEFKKPLPTGPVFLSEGVTVKELSEKLGVLAKASYGRLWAQIRKNGWNEPGSAEPNQVDAESPQRMERICLRAVTEDAISESRAAELLGISVRKLNQHLMAQGV